MDELPYVGSVAELEQFGTPDRIPRDKVEARLSDVHREWIEGTPLVFVATSSLDGRCDVSPKGDPPGFVRVLDEVTLAIPERSGNRRMDGFRNILENPHAGLIFVIPGRPETLRVNGRARIVTDGPFFDSMTVRSHRPQLALVINVEETFFHCPKAFARSMTWKPSRWDPTAVRPYAEIAHALWRRDESLESIEARNHPDLLEAQLYQA
ncbi:pyridoxamine 5'-phosphate oxidase family protein [Kribbella sp. NBC_00709]|uniref:MSMEG_1061 family FMN-dependent PPOX-type flavoprotein n=1 Tax=Kribbella sp. NBC_00709 TaxID=2975972 RepID=UPI002E2B9EA1|nr:MSMEG_1061 family FMN-dependent PPOX-type flavoprotein [Kribbella sp. NBC_00709]